MTTDYVESDYSPVETPLAPETGQTITDSQVVIAGPSQPPPVVISKPTDEPIQASTGAMKSLLTTLATFLAALPAAFYGLMGEHKEITIWAMIIIGAVAIVYMLRQLMLDIVRMWTASRPDKYSVK